MEPDDDGELSRVLREWEAPEAPAWLEGRVIARRAARRRPRVLAAWGVAAALAASALWMVRRPEPRAHVPAAVVLTADGGPFIPVPNVLPLDSYETGRVLRMDLPVSELTAAGYSLPAADPGATVTVDVLAGEDGRVHAVRLVPDTDSNGTGD
jgi:hypothetical protein